ncbi:hypothetical protein UlMin_022878 [Ulmus minor]
MFCTHYDFPTREKEPLHLKTARPYQSLACGNLGSSRSLHLPKNELKPPPYPLHHRAYVDNLNKQIAGTELDGVSLEDVIVVTYNKGVLLPPFNNAAQVWNHNFFWESMKPSGGGNSSGELLELIKIDFGSFDKFIAEFKSPVATQFGSCWAWLVYAFNKGAKECRELLLQILNIMEVWRFIAYHLGYSYDHGHSTPDWIALSFEVTNLLKKGHLQDLLSDKGKNTLAQRETRRDE